MVTSYRDLTTLKPFQSGVQNKEDEAIGLTIVLHPDAARIGEVAKPFDIGSTATRELCRFEPKFSRPGEKSVDLNVAAVSRRPLVMKANVEGAVTLSNPRAVSSVVVEGEALKESMEISADRVKRGVVIELGKYVALLLHRVNKKDEEPSGDDLGIRGESRCVQRLRKEILDIANIDDTVLISGETGVGKDLVARAIHAKSKRAGRAYLCINMGALQSGMENAELFGIGKRAATEVDERKGYFASADGGTLFLDEIGTTKPELQAVLLRAIENKEIQRVGHGPLKVDVRLIAATDSDLTAAVEQGRFLKALFHRLSRFHIRIAPLRERPDDIARLFFHFLRGELRKRGSDQKLFKDAKEPGWLPASLMSMLLRYAWKGNVRELQNVAAALALTNYNNEFFHVESNIVQLLGSDIVSADSAPEGETKSFRPSYPPTDDEVIQAMNENDFNATKASESLHISRDYLLKRISRIPSLRRPKDITDREIIDSYKQYNGDFMAMAKALRISARGLKIQITNRGLLLDDRTD
ncbi:MAG: sigma-54-dependent Fis family transcriptional regulator [Deltaproteobacteria bacterium]|nr:sigma-54-dependent Fis family transcriptional regulator [Deltaproteobacteria bacterium]